MKKIYIAIVSIWAFSAVNAQILTNGKTTQNLLETNYFLDASNFQGQADASNGKLLGFPKTDLTKFKFNLGVVTDDVVLSGFDGVIVYNTVSGTIGEHADGGYTADAMGKQVTVEPGFYYFSNPNGADNQSVTEGKWIRLSDTEVNAKLWAQRQANGITETYLKPALAKNDFVGYNNNRNFRINIGEVTKEQTNWFSNKGEAYGLAMGESPIEFYTSSDVLPLTSNYGNSTLWGNSFFFNRNVSILKEAHVSAAVSPSTEYKNSYTAGENYIVARDVTSEVATIKASHNSVDLFSNATVKNLIALEAVTSAGSSNDIYNPSVNWHVGIHSRVRNYSTSNVLEGIYSNVYNKGEVNHIRGIRSNVITQGEDENNNYLAHTIQSIRGIDSRVTVSPNATVAVNTKGIDSRYIGKAGTTNPEHIGVFNSFTLDEGASVENFYGYRLHLPVSSNATVNRAYGIHLDNISFADTDNYAIYTNAGTVRFGDSVGIGVNAPTEKLEVAGNVKANRAIFTNLPVYANDDAADADVDLPSGSLYKLQGSGRQVFVKP